MARTRYPWIKLWFDSLTDPKIARLNAAERGIWYELLLLAGQSPIRGKLMITDTVPMSQTDIKRLLRLHPSECRVLSKLVPKLCEMKCIHFENLNDNSSLNAHPRVIDASSTRYPSVIDALSSPHRRLNNSKTGHAKIPKIAICITNFIARQEVFPSDLIPDKVRINSAETPLDEDVDGDEDKENNKSIGQKFNDYAKALRDRFPEIKDFDAEMEKFQLWWAEGGRRLKRPKLALLNWMKKAAEPRKEGINGGNRRLGAIGSGFSEVPRGYTDPEKLRH